MLLRIDLDLAVPLPEGEYRTVAEAVAALPVAARTKLIALRTAARELRALAVAASRYEAVRARVHLCGHDAGGVCLDATEIE